MTHKNATESLPAPSWLDQDAAAEWRRLVETAQEDETDPRMMASYCSTLALWRRVNALVTTLEAHDAHSWTQADGTIRQHPVVAVEARLAADLIEYAEAMGLKIHDLEGRRPTCIIILDEGPARGIAE